MFERPILFYSEYCQHSKNFINALIKNQDLYQQFIRINIDVDSNTKKRPQVFYDIQNELNIAITEVPTIITPGPEYVLVGSDAFSWLENILNNNNNSDTISGFNSMEMGSFSDSYSTYGSSDLYDAKEQTFKFINKPDEPIAPPENNIKTNMPRQQNDNSNKFKGKKYGSDKQKELDDRLQKMIAERESFGKHVERM